MKSDNMQPNVPASPESVGEDRTQVQKTTDEQRPAPIGTNEPAPVAPELERWRDTGEPDGTPRPAAAAEPNKPGTAAAVEPTTDDLDPDRMAELWPEELANSLRDRWQELQLQFVDDPQRAAESADRLAVEAIDALTESLSAARNDLATWRRSSNSDTEGLRVAVQRYHTFLDKVLAL